MVQAVSDVFLGWSRFQGPAGEQFDFYFRQLWDGKGSAAVDDMGPKRLGTYAWHCGAALALAHARSGDPAMISGYLGDDETFDHVIAAYAQEYADINERDHASHVAAIDDGRIEVIRDI